MAFAASAAWVALGTGLAGCSGATTSGASGSGTGSASGGTAGGTTGSATNGAISVAGNWSLSADWGTLDYTAAMTLAQQGTSLSGAIPTWYSLNSGMTDDLDSMLSGSITGLTIGFTRIDASGFRSTFTGTVASNGETMTGTVANDPTAPGGNALTGNWVATRIASPDAGSTSGAPDAGSISCADLNECCAELSADEQIGCQAVFSQGPDSVCSLALEAYWAEGQCRDIGPSYLVPVALTVDAGTFDASTSTGAADASSACGTPVFPARQGGACVGTMECVIAGQDACSTAIADSCPCQGLQFCCIYAAAEYCYYDSDPSYLATAMSNCGGTVSYAP